MEDKSCTKCSVSKPSSEFNFRDKRRGVRHTHCRTCQSNYKKRFYEKDRSAYKAAVKRSNKTLRERNRRFLWEYLLARCCIDCGEDDPIKLEFDHLRDKTSTVKKMISNKRSIASIEAEIAKCEVVCANCHRVRTAARAGWYEDYL